MWVACSTLSCKNVVGPASCEIAELPFSVGLLVSDCHNLCIAELCIVKNCCAKFEYILGTYAVVCF